MDAADRVYIADAWNNRVQVFDKDGAYLTTIAGSWGTRTGQTRSAEGVAIAPNGDVIVADWGNHRIQKFAPGVPGWRQVNINGFGDRNASWMSSLLPFQGSLYATGYPARIWRMTAAGVWSQANADGFGDDTNHEIDALDGGAPATDARARWYRDVVVAAIMPNPAAGTGWPARQ